MDSKQPADYAKCSECPLGDRPFVPSYGPHPEDAVAVIVGEAPGVNEVRLGCPFVGDSGELLNQVAEYVGLDMSKVYLTNAVMCHPQNNELPPKALTCCADRLKKELQPYFDVNVPVATAGAKATRILTGHQKISKVRCRWQNEGTVLPMWHPAYILRSPNRLSEFVADMKKLAKGKAIRLKEPTYEIFPRPCASIFSRLHEHELLVCDIEATGLDYRCSEILSIGFAVSPEHAYIIPKELLYDPARSFFRITEQLQKLFDMPNLKIVGHNFKFDMRFLRHQLGIDNVRVDYDTMIAHYILNENTSHGLKGLVASYFDVDDYEQKLIKRHLGRSKDYSRVPLEDLYEYNAKDVCYNYALWEVLEKELKEEGLYEKPFLDPSMKLVNPLLDSELHGIYVDRLAFDPLQSQVHDTIDALHLSLELMSGRSFNPNSPKQVSEIMYDQFKMPIVSGRNFKERSTAIGARIAIKKQIDPESDASRWLDMYDELKKVEKIRSSYIDNLPKNIDRDSRVHPEFKISGTEIGRLSASNPAIQTVPRATTAAVGGVEWGKAVRSLFAASPGKILIQADYSQAEWRCAAALSNDPYLLEIFDNERDIHSEVAAGIYGESFTKAQRSITKNFTFSYLYGGTEYSFAKDAGIPLERAREFIYHFNAFTPALTDWREAQSALVEEQGYITTITGRRRRFPLIVQANAEEARKASIHFPIAGLAAEIMLAAIIRLHEWLKSEPKIDTTLLFTVHDSAIFEAPSKFLHQVAENAKYIMEDVAERIAPQVKWKVDVEFGPNWGELKEYAD